MCGKSVLNLAGIIQVFIFSYSTITMHVVNYTSFQCSQLQALFGDMKAYNKTVDQTNVPMFM